MNSEKNDDEYEIVNNRKLKKCKENQIRNPITKRCVLKSSDIVSIFLIRLGLRLELELRLGLEL